MHGYLARYHLPKFPNVISIFIGGINIDLRSFYVLLFNLNDYPEGSFCHTHLYLRAFSN